MSSSKHIDLLMSKVKDLREIFKPDTNGDIHFPSDKNAQEFLVMINTELEILIKRYRKSLNGVFEGNIVDLSSQIESMINEKTKEAFESAKQKLGNSGFNLTLTSPGITLNSSQVKLDKMLKNAYTSKSTPKTGSRRKSGVWGSICSLFGTSDWGWENYTYTKNQYSVNINKIYLDIHTEFKSITQQFNISFKDYLTCKYQPEIDSYLAELVTYLERYKGALIDGEQSKKNLEKKNAEILKARLKNLEDLVVIQNKDLKVINKALQKAIPNAS